MTDVVHVDPICFLELHGVDYMPLLHQIVSQAEENNKTSILILTIFHPQESIPYVRHRFELRKISDKWHIKMLHPDIKELHGTGILPHIMYSSTSST